MKGIKSFLKNLFTVNVGIKLFSLAAAVVLWFAVVNSEDPNQTRTFTSNVVVTNEYILSADNKYYDITGDSSVTFRVTAARSVMDKLSEADFQVTANMENLVDDKRIPIEITSDNYTGSIDIVSKTQYLYVSIGDIKSVQLQITPETSGTPGDGCLIGDITVDPRDVTLTGPDYLVDSIAKIIAEVDMTGATADVTSNTLLQYVDASGNALDVIDLEGRLTSAAVNVEVLTEKELPLNFITTGTLGDELFVKDISSDVGTVKVVGKANVLKDVHSLNINSEDMDLTDRTKSFSVDVDLADYLPAGCSLADEESSKITVEFEIAASADRSFHLKAENLKVTGLASGYRVNFTKPYYDVVISGDAEELDELTESNIIGTIDLDDLKEGTQEVEISFEVPDKYKVKNAVKISVGIVKE